MRKFNISKGIVNAIEALYESSRSAVLREDEVSDHGDWFCTRVGVRQGCLLSPTLFNICLEYIMMKTLDGFEGSFSIGGRTVTNLRFTDDIILCRRTDGRTEHMNKKARGGKTAWYMQISAEKSKVMSMGSSDNLDSMH